MDTPPTYDELVEINNELIRALGFIVFTADYHVYGCRAEWCPICIAEQALIAIDVRIEREPH